MQKSRFRIVTAAFVVSAVYYTLQTSLYDISSPDNIHLRPQPVDASLTRNRFLSWKNRIVSEIQKTASVSIPDYMQVYFQYDTSAKTALIDLITYLYDHKVPLPLFRDRVTSPAPQLSPPKICVGVVSARRPKAPFTYLVQGVSALLNRMNYKKYKDDVYIHVFNVDNEPEDHTEFEIIRDLVPVTNVKVPIPTDPNFPVQTHYHENKDNAEIIRIFSRIGCQYPIFLEDDSLATNEWVESVLLAIQQLEAHKDNWFMVRLFTARSVYPILKSRGLNDYDQEFGAVSLMLNPKYMVEYASELDKIVEKTVTAKNHDLHIPKDHVAADFSKNHHLRIFAFEPVIFQHTGMYSSVSDRPVNRGTVTQWFMFSRAFEADRQPIVFNKAYW
jgi:hypothetical protein